MKKSLVLAVCAVSVLAMTSVQAIEIKKPDVGALKNVAKTAVTTGTAKSEKSAADLKYQKEYQQKIAEQQKALNAVKAYDKQARLELAGVILEPEQLKEIKALSGEEFDKALNDAIVNVLKSETYIQDYSEYNDAKKLHTRLLLPKYKLPITDIKMFQIS